MPLEIATSDSLDFAALPPMIDVGTVASLLSCSVRHVYRLSDAGKMPRPTKLGALVRWNRAALEAWLAAGCPASRKVG